MKHGRDDYQDRIVDLEEGIPRDEPVFVLRASDVVAPDVVRFWARRAEAVGADPSMVRDVLEHAASMDRWQLANGSKIPDYPS